jgi:hypothetical protein
VEDLTLEAEEIRISSNINPDLDKMLHIIIFKTIYYNKTGAKIIMSMWKGQRTLGCLLTY